MTWQISTDCPEIHIISTRFDTEAKYDKLFIGDTEYSGSNVAIDQTVKAGNVHIQFSSDKGITARGFELKWRCLEEKSQGRELLR